MRLAPASGVVGLALTILLTGSCSNGGGDGASGSTDFVGTMAGAEESAELRLTIGTKVSLPAVQADVLGASNGASVSGSVIPAGGTAIQLNGNYSSGGLTASGGGYSLTGQVTSGGLSGTFTGPNGPGGFTVLQGGSGTATVYCGTILSQSSGQHGAFNLIIRGTSVTGLAIGGGGVLPIAGTISGNTISISGTLAGVTITASGTVSGTTVSGTYSATGAVSDNGTWAGGPCAGSGTSQSCSSVGGNGEPGTITQTTQWVDGPHHLTQNLLVKNGAILIIHQGVVVCADPGVGIVIGADGSDANLSAVGTANNPVRFEATDASQGWEGILVDTNQSAALLRTDLVEVRITDAKRAVEGHRWIDVDRVFISGYREVGLDFHGIASVIQVTVAGYAGPGGSGTAVQVGPGSGLSGANMRLIRVDHAGQYGVRVVGGLARLQDCELTAGAGDGMVIEAAASTFTAITGCNITNNAGVGVNSAASSNIFAQGNWWGDAAGPAGAAGDGVTGAVDASQPASTPFSLGPFPALRGYPATP